MASRFTRRALQTPQRRQNSAIANTSSNKTMSRKHFGTDGIRGRVGEAPITPDFVLRLGYAAGKALAAKDSHPAVLIGKDTRISGYMLESALEAGLSAAGVDTLLVGPMPTPGVAFLTRALRLSAGIMVSASHNPFEDNGIKFFSGDGFKLPDAIEAGIESLLEEPMVCAAPAKLGKARRVHDAEGRYIEFCKSTFPKHISLRGLKIVLDCAHGAAYRVAPRVFEELGAEVTLIGHQPNGTNINAGVGATAPEALAKATVAQAADLGIALDGDGDRLVMCDSRGQTFDGDQLLYVVAAGRHRAAAGVAGVAGTLMSNLALEQQLGSMNIPFARAKVGDRYVLEMMREKGWLLGGENSGHIICLDQHTTGDGLISALQVLAALIENQADFATTLASLTLYPQVMVNVRVARRFDFLGITTIASAIDDAENSLKGRGRVLIRPSGTEPVIRVMVEGPDRSEAERWAAAIAKEITVAAELAA
jgi:phosphoglucosamine mutase